MIAGKQFHSIIHRIFNGDVKNYLESQQIQVNCPKCQQRANLSKPDGKYNLEINTAKKIFRCWKCDEPKFSGGLGKLIRLYGTPSDYELYKSYGGEIYDFINNDEEDLSDELVEISLPKEFIPFSKMDTSNENHLEAYLYLVVDRKLSKDTIFKYHLGFCTEGKYRNRIIIPSFNNEGTVNYFVTRTYKKNERIKYLNPNLNKRLFIFNEGLINWDSTVYLVEGGFEMLSIVNAIPLLGKDLLDRLFFLLKEKRPNIIIVLDPDALYNAIQLFQKITMIYVGEEHKVKIVKMSGDMDLDEIRAKRGKESVLKLLRTATELNTDDYLMMKEREYAKGKKPFKNYR